jgi:signal transduction histidine kinase
MFTQAVAAAGNPQFTISNPKAARTFKGTVTLVDTNRDLVVLQDQDHPIPIKLDSVMQSLHVGETIVIEGRVFPYFKAFPDYPDRPSGREIMDSFEAPTDWAKHYLTRMHGFLRPPQDGEYTFWIAGDDEAELLLSSNQEMANARKIAFAPRATWPREWERYPQQKSEPVFLKAGETYYVEAIQRQWRGHDCLAVAWQGPGIKQSVIDGQYLLPDQGNVAGATNGILREYWTNFFVTTLAMLTPEPQQQVAGSVSEPRLKITGVGNMPQPGKIHIGEPWNESNNFRWVEVEGTSAFVANNNGNLTMEVTNADGRITAHIFNWGTNSTVSLENRKVRVRGVCEGVNSEKGESVAGTLWVPDVRQIDLLDFTDNDWSGLEPIPMFDLVPSNPSLAWGRRVLVRGTILEHNPESEAVPVQGDDSFYGYISDDGTNWTQVGVPVSIALSNTACAGLAVSSMANYQLPIATFDRAGRILETSRFADIGASRTPGGVQYSNATFAIRVHGGGIDDTEEKCNFLFESLPDEGEIVARVKTFQGVHVSDKGGIMIRESLDDDSPSVSLMVTPESKICLQYQTPGASSRVVALVLNRTPGWLKLVRRRHLLTVFPRQTEEFMPHQSVEIVGNLTWQNNLPALTEAYLRPVLNSSSRAVEVAQSPNPQYIRIKDLPSETDEGSLRYASRSFRIRGIVTFSDKAFNRNLIFVQDDSGGALVRVLPELIQYKPLEAGQFIEAEGTIKFTRGAAPLGIGSATVLGLGQMPPPLPFPDRSLAADAEGQWVQAEGVVRSVQDDGTLLLMEKDGEVKIWLKGLATNTVEHYVDALVQVRGVYSKHIQSHPILLVPSLDYMQVKESPPADPFVIPSFSINQVSAQDVDPQTLHRLKVTGVVTYRDDNLLFVQDNTGSVQILTTAQNTAGTGDRVEIIGFPEKRSGSITLTEAMVRKTGRGQPPKPSELSLSDVAEGRFNGSVVRLEAIVLEQKIRDGQQLLELQMGQRVFQGILPKHAGPLESFPVGSRVQVTGVNRVQFADHINAKTSQQDNSMPATVDVLLRGPWDVVLLQRPPWWNWKYTAGLGTVCVVVFAISFIWIRTLRRRVEERTRELKATMARLQKETETSATLVERDRLAGEIHDSLEQGLNGIMMQLDGVDSKLNEDSNGARHYLEMARNMVRFSRAEVRHSLWNLESELLANGDLGAALTEVARQMSSSNRVRVAIEVLGSASQLPPATEHHLLRICQEALNNALKHAEAKTIQITLNYSGQSVQLTIADDGCGFAPDLVLTGTGTHLGLRNLRSRARKIKGRLQVISQPSKGTTIEVRVPINNPVDGVANHN